MASVPHDSQGLTAEERAERLQRLYPGPWVWAVAGRGMMLRAANQQVVIRVGAAWVPTPEARDLLAATPSLLAACEGIEPWLPLLHPSNPDGGSFLGRCRTVRTAIALARQPVVFTASRSSSEVAP